MDELLALPTPVLVAIGALAVIQIGLEVYALVDIIRRPADRITGGNKVLWILLVVLVNLIGAVIYLAVGRQPERAQEVTTAAPSSGAAASRAVDTLYGRRDPQ